MYRNESENYREKKVKQTPNPQNSGEVQIDLIQTEERQKWAISVGQCQTVINKPLVKGFYPPEKLRCWQFTQYLSNFVCFNWIAMWIIRRNCEMKETPLRNVRTHVNNCHVYSWAYKSSSSAKMAIWYHSFHSKSYAHFHLFQTKKIVYTLTL